MTATHDFTVLLVDDNQHDRDLARHHLERRLVRVIEAGTLTDALAICCQADVVLLDLSLPDSPGGFETVRRMTRGCDCSPVVAITGHDEPGLGPACLAAGAVEYVTKDALLDGERLYQKLAFIVRARLAIVAEGG